MFDCIEQIMIEPITYLTFSDDESTQGDFDVQAETRLQHVFDNLRLHTTIGTNDGHSIEGKWQNDVVLVYAHTQTTEDSKIYQFAASRISSPGHVCEAVIVVPTDLLRSKEYFVRRLEDGWYTEYPLGQADVDGENRTIHTWAGDPAAARDSKIPIAAFISQTNTILADLQSCVSRAVNAANKAA